MIYQFELDGITNCGDCPCCDTVSGCQLREVEESFDKIPADCPLVAISKTETTTPITLADKVKRMAHCAIDAGIIDAVDWSAEIIKRLEEKP